VLATLPAAGEGANCDINSPDDCGVQRDTDLHIRFDRFLLPTTSIRQSVRIYSGNPDNALFPEPEYDLVERVVIYRVPPLDSGLLYTVEILRPEDDDNFGFKAFDGAHLEEGEVPLRFDFRTNKLPPITPSPAPPAPATCKDALDVFSTSSGGGCASGICHNSAGSTNCPSGSAATLDGDCIPVPRMGLELTTREALISTAIGRVAHQAETGSKTGVPLSNPPRFGTAMPIIQPQRPELSYLMYKMLRRDDSFYAAVGNPDTCVTQYPLLPFGAQSSCIMPSVEERTRLREWFVRGEPMPLVMDSAAAYGKDSLLTIQSWIRAGARTDNCQ
jgi:hypothetical protein